MTRISRDELFMQVAASFAQRSTCLRGNVGAVIVKNRHIIAHGYNGAPAGMPQCDEVGCDEQTWWETYTDPASMQSPTGWTQVESGCLRTVHAEANAVAYASRVGVACEGAVMYTTHEPCRKCAELIIQAGICKVFFSKPYRLGASEFLDKANIPVITL
jgi:dCMP deaminase